MVLSCCKNLFLNLSVPHIFIYKDINIFISALSRWSVGCKGNRFFFFFFLALRSIAGWYIYIFFFYSLACNHYEFYFIQSQLF